MRQFLGTIRTVQLYRLGIVALLVVIGLFYFSRVYGDDLPLRSLLVSDNSVGATATYTLSFTVPNPETLGSIQLLICANDPLFQDPCTVPPGFDISHATLSSQSGETGFVISPGTNANTLILTRVPVTASVGAVRYTLTGVINPSANGTYYGRLQTFASTDASGAENDHGGLAFSMNGPVSVHVTVPPYLLFCTGIIITGLRCDTASGNYINFGDFSSTTTSRAQSQMLLATNAQSGYGVQVYGSTLTSGNNIITALANRDVSRPGTSQFGLNLVANQTPSVGMDPAGPGSATPASAYDLPNWYKFSSGDTIASVAAADSYRQLTVSYMVNIPGSQPVGAYVATLTFVCLANF